MNTQPLLFDIPSFAETGVWCQLNDGIDPAQWAGLCRKIGQLTPQQFQEAQNRLFPPKPCKKQLSQNPDSLISRLKRVFSFNQAEAAHLPLVSIGPERLDDCN